MCKISVIVPCYNEQESLHLFYDKLKSVLFQMNCSYEVLLIDDGSEDKTKCIMKELAENDNHVKYLSFSRNFGKEAGMYAGFCNVKGEYVAVMDADMQDPPELLPRMLQIIEDDGYDSVATRRVNREGEPRIRSFFARQFYKLINKISDVDIVDGARDFRLMRRDMVDAIVSMTEYNRFSKGIYGWIGYKTYWMSFENVERIAGETKWSFWKLLKYAIGGIVDFSQVPLHVASWGGILLTFCAFAFLIVIVARRLLYGDPVAGWASMTSIILFMGGLQLFFMGVIGQYIARIYTEAKHRPHYIIAESNISGIDKVR